VTASAALLRHGGRLGIEHDDTHADAVPDLLRGAGCWRTSRSTAISRVAPASRLPAARLSRCSESGFQCGQCTQSRFRYTRGIACRA
jgi:hypothetical protein